MLRSESGIDRQIGLGSDKDTVVVKREQSVKAKPSIYWSIYAPTLTLRFVGSSVYWLKEWNDRYKWQKWVYCEVCSCSALETGQGALEELLLHIKRSQLRWFGYLTKMPPGRLPGEIFWTCIENCGVNSGHAAWICVYFSYFLWGSKLPWLVSSYLSMGFLVFFVSFYLLFLSVLCFLHRNYHM